MYQLYVKFTLRLGKINVKYSTWEGACIYFSWLITQMPKALMFPMT